MRLYGSQCSLLITSVYEGQYIIKDSANFVVIQYNFIF